MLGTDKDDLSLTVLLQCLHGGGGQTCAHQASLESWLPWWERASLNRDLQSIDQLTSALSAEGEASPVPWPLAPWAVGCEIPMGKME